MRRLVSRIWTDIASGRHIEVYVVSAVAVAVGVLSVIGDIVPINIQLAAILAALAVLVFKSSVPASAVVDLDAVLHDRQSYGPFRDFIRNGSVLWIYGPSAVNVLSDTADLEREVLAKGGEVRVLLQDPAETASLAILHRQLDTMNYLLEDDINRSISILERLKAQGRPVDYRFLPYSPGFSLVIVDPDGRDGRAIVEFYGFSNELITDRMHLEIRREQSHHWLEYWAKQYEEMWNAAREPD
jgi:hypothetical protein